MADASTYNPTGGNSNASPYANSTNNGLDIEDVDPKALVDDWTTTQNAPAGNYPYGIDMNNGDLFMPVTDHTDATDINTGSRTPASMLPRHPLSGEMESRSAKRTIPRS